MSGKREAYTHRPMQVSDDTLKANWDAINWNSRDAEALPDMPEDQGVDGGTQEA